MQERRAESRQRCLKKGKIVFNDRNSLIDCRIRDMTPGGVRLLVENPLFVPNHFTFIDTFSRVERMARLVWRGEREIGVAFASPGMPGEFPVPDGDKVVPCTAA